MRRNNLILKVIILSLLLMIPLSSFGRARYDPDDSKNRSSYSTATPEFCIAGHNVGKIVLAVNNNGTFGDGFAAGSPSDCFTGVQVPSCEYPKNSNSYYLFAGAFWIGAVIGRDTLVSVGADGWLVIREFYPDEAPFGKMVYRSIIDPAKSEYKDAISEQDYISVYTDTFTSGVPGLGNDALDGRPHKPLHIEATQRSYAWSYPYAEDFVLFDYSIKNIGREGLNQVYMGIYVDADVHAQGSDVGFDDDVCGFLHTYDNPYGDCVFEDTVYIAWIADNDGDLSGGGLLSTPVPHVTATRIVRTPQDELEVSFNWWVSNGTASLDFGPRLKSDNFRDLGFGQLGTPEGDRNKYDFLRNKEFDYDQVYTASISANDPFWLYPNQTIAKDISNGFDTRYLLSFGPFNIEPGQTLPISFAYLAGENFHTDPTNAKVNLDDNYDPDAYYANINFDDMSLNAMWASWVYDNPGVDSDDDKYFGEFRLCCEDSTIDSIVVIDTGPPLITDTSWLYFQCDTFWYQGDGVPDFRGASPPPAPSSWSSTKDKYGNPIQINSMRVSPSISKITVRWNGLRSETTRDVFSREFDFEGFRVYLARDERESSYSLMASYDIEDYNKYLYNATRDQWELTETPFTLDELRCLYGDTVSGSPCNDLNFNPEEYTRSNPLIIFDTTGKALTIFFEPQDFNRSTFANYPEATTPMRKVYPDQPYPSSLSPDSADTSELTESGFLKYFEYEYTIDNLLPTVPYYVNVTAFDFGSPQSGLGSLETSRTNLAEMVYPLNSVDSVEAKNLEVYVYPNPYRVDGNYIEDGFEGRNAQYYIPDRMRRLHFANLPAKCTIRIYTLDGDLIREIEHDMDPSDPTAMHDEWDMITRNTQRIVTGIYYWVVEEANGDTQIGKLVIIM